MQGGSRSRSRSASPQREVYVKPPELLAQCISVITTVISNDCRYQVSVPRLKRPPNALQAITLDVAQFLLHAHWHSPKVISQIGFAVIQAFQTFRPAMHTRLLTFFDECVVGGILEQLGQVQGMPFLDPTSPTAGQANRSSTHDCADTHILQEDWMEATPPHLWYRFKSTRLTRTVGTFLRVAGGGGHRPQPLRLRVFGPLSHLTKIFRCTTYPLWFLLYSPRSWSMSILPMVVL